MQNDFLWDSPLYQELVGEQREAVRMQVVSQAKVVLLTRIKDRFPALEALASKCLDTINDNSTLLKVGMDFGASQTEQNAKEVLESYLNEHKERGK